MTLAYVSPREGVIDGRRLAGGVMLVIRAEDVRRTNTGLHAKVTIAIAENEGATKAHPVTSDVLNIDKESYRHDFTNTLYGIKNRKDPKFSADFIEAYPRSDFESDLYEFSEEFYAQLLGTSKGEYVSGDAEKTMPGFWAEGLVLKDGGTILYAPPKSAKSYTALLLAVSIDAGVQTLFRVEQAKVMYLNLERGKSSLSRRLGLCNRVLGLPAERPLLMLNKRGRTLADVYDAAKDTVESEKVQCVVLDSLSRAGFGNLNDNDKGNLSMDYLNRLCGSWLAIGHTPRADATHIFGSIMFDAAMDIGVAVKPQRKPDGTLGVGLHVQDTNDTGVPPLRVLAYEFDVYGLTVARDAERMEFPDIMNGGAPRTNIERVYDQLVAYGKMSVTQLSDDLKMNAGTVHAEIKKLLDANRIVSLGREGRSLLYGVKTSQSFNPEDSPF